VTVLALSAVILGMILSAVYTASEIAIVAVNRLRLRHLVRIGAPGAKRSAEIAARPDAYLATTLIGLNLANSITAVAATALVVRLGWPATAAGKSALFIVASLLFFFVAELLPKTIVRLRPTLFLLYLSGLLHLSYRIFRPAVSAVERLSRRAFGKVSPRSRITRKEIEALIQSSEGKKVLPEFNGPGAARLFAFHRLAVGEVMTPRRLVAALPVQARREDLFELVRETGFTRIPIYEKPEGDFIGLVNIYDFLYQEEPPDKLVELLRQAPVVETQTSAWEALLLFQTTPHRLAFVKDNQGRHVGIVTAQDLVEEILGELREEAA